LGFLNTTNNLKASSCINVRNSVAEEQQQSPNGGQVKALK